MSEQQISFERENALRSSLKGDQVNPEQQPKRDTESLRQDRKALETLIQELEK